MDERLNEWLEMGMIESDRRRCALKVLSLFICENVGRGENYLSNLKRIKMEVLLHSGEQETRYMIYKSPPLGESRARLVSKIGVFVRETRVYLDVLPEMEEIVKKKEPMGDFLWPQLHCSQRRYDGLLMEDLSVKGFKMGNRRKGLDFDHCALVMRSLAKFHALGAVLRFKDYLKIKDFYPAVFNGPSIRVPGVAKDILQTCAYNMETKWGEEWADLAERMNVLADNIERLMVDENKLDAMQFNTLNHGDCWINNILFRYDKNGKPEALRFIDFQMATYNIPGFDLQFFLMTSPDFATRDRKEELLLLYHKSLSEYLRLYGYPEDDIPSMQGVMVLYEGAQFFGFSIGITTLPIILSKKGTDEEEQEQLPRRPGEKREVKIENVYAGTDEYLFKLLKYIIQEGARNDIL